MKYIFYGIAGLVVVGLIYVALTAPKGDNGSVVNQPSTSTTGTWDTKTDEQPPVTVVLTPIELGKNIGTWKFAIVFDTHSGSLDDDMLAVATLVDDKGNTYRPTAWEGSDPGGHHREGVLVFTAIDPMPPYVELKIRNVGSVPERSFTWELK